MIDRDARRRLGRLMRNFAIGRITNVEFDDAFENIDSQDKGIWLIGLATFADFNMYKTVRLTGEYRETKDWRRMTARWLLFLQTNLEYAKPPLPWQERVQGLLTALTFGAIPKGPRLKEWEWHEQNVWPFLTPEQLQEARQHPRLLCG